MSVDLTEKKNVVGFLRSLPTKFSTGFSSWFRTSASDDFSDNSPNDQRTLAISPEILAEVRRLNFQTRRLTDQGLMGGYRSAFRGHGIEFEEVREYTPGDEIRSIDWKVTAKTGTPYIKSYREERELTVIIAVDVSSSTLTGTASQLREHLIAKIGAILTLVAMSNNDKVGLVTFSDKIETYHPPRKARGAVWRILHEVLMPSTRGKGTNLAQLGSFLSSVIKGRAIIFVLSDFIGNNYSREFSILSRKHDLTAITIQDPADDLLPESCLVAIRDPETGIERLIDTSSATVRAEYQVKAEQACESRNQFFDKLGIGHIEISTEDECTNALRKYFHKRDRRFR